MTVIRRSMAAVLLASGLAVGIQVPRADAACVAGAPAAPAIAEVTPAGFVPTAPVRIADTRNGIGVAAEPIDAGCVLRVRLAAGDPPGNATAVALTITSDGADRTGYVTAYACGSPRPGTSVLNPEPGDPRSNLAVVALDPTREVCFFSEQRTHLIVDVTGWFSPTGARSADPAAGPTRPFDSRRDLGRRLGAGEVIVVASATPANGTGSTGVGLAVTVTLTEAAEPTFATVFPCAGAAGARPPATSTVNTLPGIDRAAPALVGTGPDVCAYVDRPTHLIVDVTTSFVTEPTDVSTVQPESTSPLFQLATARLADSRVGLGWAAGRLRPDILRRVDLLDVAPVGTTTVQLNLTATDVAVPGYLTAYPCETAMPPTSSLNYRRDDTAAAMVTVPLGADGKVCVFSSGEAHVIVDLLAGYGERGLVRTIAGRVAGAVPVGAGQTDFAIRCTEGIGPSDRLRITTPPGIGLGGITVDGLATTTLPLVLGNEMNLTLTLTGRSTETVVVRCLPPGFPDLEPSGSPTTPGWYVASSLPATGNLGFAFILDQYGTPVWWKRTPNPVVGVWPLADGTLAWRRWTGGGFPGGAGVPESPPLGYEIHDLTGALVDTVGPVGGTEPLDWHELLELPGGGHLVVTYPIRTTGQSRTCTKATDGGTTTTTRVVDSDLVELDAAGTEVWRWSSEDHTDIATETRLPICFKIGPGANDFALDYMHLNSVERLADGDYVVSARHFDAVVRIDRTTGDIEWKLGGAAPLTGVHLAIKDVNGAPAGSGSIPGAPHDARVLANGNVTLHDNHVGGVARAGEYVIDVNAGTATLVWQHLSRNPTGATLGSVRRQADGSTVIGWGEGRTPWLEEVGPDGRTTFEIDVTSGENFYRVVKVPLATFDRATLRALAGGTSD